jgi:hypothetical protein
MKIKIVQLAKNKPDSGRVCPWAIDDPPHVEKK